MLRLSDEVNRSCAQHISFSRFLSMLVSCILNAHEILTNTTQVVQYNLRDVCDGYSVASVVKTRDGL